MKVCALDYRLLFEVKHPYAWFVKNISEKLLSMRFERLMRSALVWHPDAEAWLKENWERRNVGVVSVGVPVLGRAIDMIVGDYTAECFHFGGLHEFRRWISLRQDVFRVYTNDPLLLGLDDITVPFNGWNERL